MELHPLASPAILRIPTRAHRPVIARWVTCVATAEFLGFGIPAGAGAAAYAADVSPAAFLAIMVFAGAGEGALLGAGQALALRRIVPGVDSRLWIITTAASAAFAWTLGMLPSTIGDYGAPAWASAVVFAAAAPLLLASIPVPQALLLARVLPVARWRWAWVSAGAWAAGLPATFAITPLIDESTSPAGLFTAFACAGAAMALIMATVTGLGLRALAATDPRA